MAVYIMLRFQRTLFRPSIYLAAVVDCEMHNWQVVARHYPIGDCNRPPCRLSSPSTQTKMLPAVHMTLDAPLMLLRSLCFFAVSLPSNIKAKGGLE